MPWFVVKRKKKFEFLQKVLDKKLKVCYNIPDNERNTNMNNITAEDMNITATYVISGKKNAPKTNPAKMVITVMKGDYKVAVINLEYVNKQWQGASSLDIFNFLACISGGAPVARLADYINAAWDYAFTCNKYAGQRGRKWDIIHLPY